MTLLGFLEWEMRGEQGAAVANLSEFFASRPGNGACPARPLKSFNFDTRLVDILVGTAPQRADFAESGREITTTNIEFQGWEYVASRLEYPGAVSGCGPRGMLLLLAVLRSMQ